MRLKIGAKISLGFMFMLLLAAVLGGNSFFSLSSTKDSLNNINDASNRLILEMKIESEFKSAVAATRAFIAYGDEKYFQQMQDHFKKTVEMENQLLSIARPDKKKDVQDLITATEKYRSGVLNELSPIIRDYHRELKAHNNEKAYEYFNQMNNKAKELIPVTEKLTGIIKELVQENDEILKNNMQTSISHANKVIYTSIIMSLLAVLAGIFLSVFLTGMIRKPILQIVSGAGRFAEGDFRDRIDINSADELGELSSAMNKMRDSFRDVLEKLKTSSNNLSQSSMLLAAQAQQTSAGASETAATMGEVASIVENMSQNTQQVSRQASLATEYADRGYQDIESVNGQMQEISVSTLQVNNSINALSQAINRIGQFVEVITNIADQTNLLALNAAIEAARAGDAGRGFAVVAEEVRKLAEQSAQSTKEIKQLIGEIDDQSRQAVESMDRGSEKVEQGNRIVSKVGQSFNEIIKAVQELTSQIQSVATAAAEVSAGVHNVAGTTEEQTATMEEVSAAAENLSKLADDLKKLVLKFKI
ncbi:MAG: methyl-accepting chemotaxis protein [Bacillota bacterium]